MLENAAVLQSGNLPNVDVCIIGAGAAGISLALELDQSGLRVLLVESGSQAFDAETQSLYRGRVVSPILHSPTDRYRRRTFGGTTTIWGGRCVPYDPVDFERRPLPLSGWPIDYTELARHYPAANRLCEAGDFNYCATTAVAGGMRPIICNFEPASFTTDSIERFSCPTNFAARYGSKLMASENVCILLNANCTEIVTSRDGRITKKLVLRTLSGKQFEVSARYFILAVGGLEAPRLLLASRRFNSRGIGNEHDLVGRYYMCHIAGTIGELRLNVPSETVWHGYERAWDGVYCRRRLTLKSEVQRQLGIGNIAMRLHHPRLGDPSHRSGILSAIYLARPFIGYEYAKRLCATELGGYGNYVRHFLNVAREPFKLASFMLDWTTKRTLAARKFPSLIVSSNDNVYSLDVHSEHLPNYESRVFLDNARDRLDMPQLVIDWRYSPCDIQTVSKALQLFQKEVKEWGRGTFYYDPDEVETCMLREGAFGGHHIGTARMAASPDEGVVDRDCRVFGIENLYIASSAVFPTSSQANPTLTIVALALRLALHLKAHIRYHGANTPSSGSKS
jgi:choline dehydrogenase-like flavoprotein